MYHVSSAMIKIEKGDAARRYGLRSALLEIATRFLELSRICIKQTYA